MGADIVQLSQNTGISVQKIIEILDESRYLFGVTASSLRQGHSFDVFIKPESQQFLLDEARSRDLHFTYRSSTILEFRSKILQRTGSERYVFDRNPKPLIYVLSFLIIACQCSV